MLNNKNKRQGYTEVYYNYKADQFFTEDFGNQFKGLDITFSGGGGENSIQIGDSISLLTNNANYVASGDNISLLTNNANYVASGDNISLLTNDVNYVVSGANISQFTNDVNYAALGDNISQFNNDANFVSSGDNISQLHNNANYVVSGANISLLSNDANYVASGDNISLLTNNANYVASGDNISLLTNNANYVASGDNISLLTNNANYVASGDNISSLTNDANYVASGDNISTLVNNAGYLTSFTIPSVTSLPTTNLSFGNLAALSTDNNPYFYDGTAWRRIFLADVPPQAGDPDTDWDKVILRVPFNTSTDDVKSSIAGTASGYQAVITGSPRKFGAGALKVQNSSYIYYSGNNPANGGVGAFLDNDFTIEFWLYIDSFNAQNQDTCIFRKGSTYFYFEYVGFNQMSFKIHLQNVGATTPDLLYNTVGNMPTGGWHHIAYCRSATSGLCQLFVDGTSEGSVNLNNMVDSVGDTFFIGDLLGNSADMIIDDLRISNFERYTSNFTAPTAELPTSGS